MVTVAGLFQVLIVLAEILGLVEWVVFIRHSAFVLEPQPVALRVSAFGLELEFLELLPFLIAWKLIIRRLDSSR